MPVFQLHDNLLERSVALGIVKSESLAGEMVAPLRLLGRGVVGRALPVYADADKFGDLLEA